METIEFTIITLEWVNAAYTDLPAVPGIYQIYGTSPLYGMDTLLYIGQAKNLRNRVKVHFNYKERPIGRQPNKTCRYAELPEDLLTAAEEILIVMHKPSFNAARLGDVKYETKSRPFYIQNHGDRGMLSLETTNYYFLSIPGKEMPPEFMPFVETN